MKTSASASPRFSRTIRIAQMLPAALVGCGLIAFMAASPTSLARVMLPAAKATSGADIAINTDDSGQVSRHFRLASALVGDAVALGGHPVRLGDRITINAVDGSKRIYAVRGIRQISLPVSDAATGGSAPGLLLVTCRDISNPSGKPLRFLVEADQTMPLPTRTDQQHAL